ncbi:MAG: PIG-L deacetylase family protein [Planctomycetota bacterium]|jgi:LmbE family N-acetylglucosaminyl deacetylase
MTTPEATANHRVALSFLAHPDDAEILCAGTLTRLASVGYDIHIATATPGDCGTMTETPHDIASTRTHEARNACDVIGATYHCLDERDLFVVFDKPTIKKAIDLFRTVTPSLVFTHAPKDYMMDHESVSLLARAASFGYGAPNASGLPLNPNSAVPHLYYCDPIGGVDPLGNPITPTTLIDIADQLETKTRMLAAHVSQREWLRAHHGMDEYIDAMHRHSAERGRLINTSAAEAFVQHRGHAYPENDILKELLST